MLAGSLLGQARALCAGVRGSCGTGAGRLVIRFASFSVRWRWSAPVRAADRRRVRPAPCGRGQGGPAGLGGRGVVAQDPAVLGSLRRGQQPLGLQAVQQRVERPRGYPVAVSTQLLRHRQPARLALRRAVQQVQSYRCPAGTPHHVHFVLIEVRTRWMPTTNPAIQEPQDQRAPPPHANGGLQTRWLWSSTPALRSGLSAARLGNCSRPGGRSPARERRRRPSPTTPPLHRPADGRRGGCKGSGTASSLGENRERARRARCRTLPTSDCRPLGPLPKAAPGRRLRLAVMRRPGAPGQENRPVLRLKVWVAGPQR